ncbi:uncharacterized protein BDZ99DRAFT_47511 [Mytilinidion resinicola]|uniref:Uncharacterized protein n=1 Tax=Mytilinidion resinicola TaxID=574789 RepID=A0A6A6YML3_9PEZI|nr:uncharacterized protein BDZ99DRAFT_47511 [Mytilinidion resinicola]KAF2809225.1 hypothetical protein BDZ99DRAFT_47511 [Mytilinidion resinicola]
MEATPEPEAPPPPTTTTIPSAAPPPAPPSPSEPESAPLSQDSIPAQQEPTPPPTPQLRPTPTTSARLAKLRNLAISSTLTTARSTDSTLSHLARLLSTPAGTDAFLCTLGYTLTLLHPALSHLLDLRLRALATKIATKADGVLLPGETLITTFEAPTSTKLLASGAAGSKALAGVISDYRIFVRLWGLLGIYSWGKGVWNAGLPEGAGGKERVLRAVAWGQVVSCAAYQVLENGAYLASKGVLVTQGWLGEAGKRREARWWVWSSRFWAAHVALEGVRLAVLYRKQKGEKEEVETGSKEDRAWWRDAVSNAAYAPLTIHWSTEAGVVSEPLVGLLGTVAGGVGLLERWRETA